ncbi:AT hook and UBX domain containing protein [Aphelenchoides besseyi]|nr:AT hook and UBX domain containing protein [Aphelenchoides besseyi]KAI6194778.1 AT hook and UBX domain containing protein [Aphelenchoides besseyi]
MAALCRVEVITQRQLLSGVSDEFRSNLIEMDGHDRNNDSSDHENDNPDSSSYDYNFDDASSITSEEQNGFHNLLSSHNTMDHLPLIPTDFSSVNEALQNFGAVFESRYGGLHPRFQSTSLRESLNEAFGITTRQAVMEQKPLAIYLHHDESIAANIFTQQVLCSDAITSLLNQQFILWPWDMSMQDNRSKLYEWLVENNLTTVKDVVKMITKPDEFPVILVVLKDRTKYDVDVPPIRGSDDVDKVMDKLLTSLDKFQEIKNRDVAEEQNRLEREQIRQEQVSEYEKSLAIDRARQEEQTRQREQEMRDQEAEQRRLEQQLQRQAEIASTLPSEPAENDPNAIMLLIRFPNGEKKHRRFRFSESVDFLLKYVESLGYEVANHRVMTSDYPRRDVTTLDASQSFAQLAWPRRETITIDEK